ncbi:hypothetical protein ACHHYP_02066 [Achlya hypogyna]|uniref:CCHC-type domain-containing protein n=1 Tax=Achlya hypogyna TaxID=1202772 RepID=A0A1V9ZSD9_ACHHY|nr:hypothetical protein ACHHYP_02066 [Achlya hypogyna]
MTAPSYGVYQRRRLSDWSEVASWQATFLNVAASVNAADYYTTPGYEDPDLANYITDARHAQLQREAETAVPPVPSTLKRTALAEAMSRRRRKVHELVSVAIEAECRAMQTARASAANAFLLSALHPKLLGSVSNSTDPYELWHSIQLQAARPKVSGGPFRAFGALGRLRRGANESAAAFVDRFDEAMDMLLAQFEQLPAGVDTTDWDASLFRAADVARTCAFHQLRVVCLVWCLRRSVEIGVELADQSLSDYASLRPRIIALVDDLDGGKVLRRDGTAEVNAAESTERTARQEGNVDAREEFKKGTKSQTTPSHEQERTADTAPLDGASCNYCYSAHHVDSTCVLREVDTLNNELHSDYVPPPEVPKPCSYCGAAHASCPARTRDYRFMHSGRHPPLRRTCTYCGMRTHIDGECYILRSHMALNCVRQGYVVPKDQLRPRASRQHSSVCAYCGLTGHADADCYRLQRSVKRGTVRSEYPFPLPQRKVVKQVKDNDHSSSAAETTEEHTAAQSPKRNSPAKKRKVDDAKDSTDAEPVSSKKAKKAKKAKKKLANDIVPEKPHKAKKQTDTDECAKPKKKKIKTEQVLDDAKPTSAALSETKEATHKQKAKKKKHDASGPAHEYKETPRIKIEKY